MKHLIYTLSIFLLLGCNTNLQKITVFNENEFEVFHKLVTLQKSELAVVADKLPTIKQKDGSFVPSQCIDKDEDGVWDQVVFQVSLDAGATSYFTVFWVNEGDYPTFDKQTQVRLGYSELRDGMYVSVDRATRSTDHKPEKPPYTYQFEGPGWESNKVAFRSYFDTRNGKDIFGKTTEKMVTQTIGRGENYHKLQDWGMDVLKVGQSLGAGSLAILKNDSLIRLGKTDSATFVKVVEGPVYSSFRLIYQGWDVLGQEYEVHEEIAIQANKRWFESTVSLRSSEAKQIDTLVVGIVNLKKADVEILNHAGIHTLYTHGQQSENKDALGMALLIQDKHFLNAAKAPTSGKGITHSELVYLTPVSGTYTYRFYAGWELENKEFADIEYFKNMLQMTMQASSAELVVKTQ